MKTLTVGVDVSQKTLDVAIVTPDSKEPMNLGSFSNNEAGFKKIQKTVMKQATKTEAELVHLVIEPTGGYEQPFVMFIIEVGWSVSMPNPYHIRQWAKGTGVRAKTDKLDAQNLAQYGTCHTLLEYKPLPANVALLEQLLKRQRELNGLLREEKNRLHAMKAKGINEKSIISSLERVIASLESELKLINDEIDSFIKQNKELKQQLEQLKSTPGVGNKNAFVLLVLFSRWQLLSTNTNNNKSLTAYTGLDPVAYESGTSVYKHRNISRQGNSTVRALLYMGALGGVRGDNPLANFYRRLVNRGKAKKLALIACARKILIWAWAVFSKNTVFDPLRFSISI